MPIDCIVIRLPDPRAIRVLARSVLLAVALLSLPWLRAVEPSARARACSPALEARLLLLDLRREGLLAPGARAVFLGADGGCGVRPVSPRRIPTSVESSVDFVLDFEYLGENGDMFGLVDRVLKVGGIVAAPIGAASAFRLPPDYKVVYIRRFAETFVAIKKVAHVRNDGNAGDVGPLAAPKEAVLPAPDQPAETESGGIKNYGRKLILSDIGRPVAHEHRIWFKLPLCPTWHSGFITVRADMAAMERTKSLPDDEGRSGPPRAKGAVLEVWKLVTGKKRPEPIGIV